MQDCIIVGGGPAGLTAALYLARYLRSVTVFDADEGRARMIPLTRNLTAFPEGISGLDLLQRMRAHAQRYGATIRRETVLAVEPTDGGFRVTTTTTAELTRHVIFASGVVNHRPPLAPEVHDLGVQRGLIRYCPVCDGYEVRSKSVAILGDGPHAADEARFVRPYADSVTLVAMGGPVAAVAGQGVDHLDAPLQDLVLKNSQVVVTVTSGAVHRFDTLYVAMGTTPRTEIAATLGLVIEGGHIRIDAEQRTSMKRVYAIGDVTEGLDQIAVAMGQGAIAATALHNDAAARDEAG